MMNQTISPISIHTTSLCLDVIYSPQFHYTETKDVMAMTDNIQQLIRNRCIDDKLYLDDVEVVSRTMAHKAVLILINYQFTVQKPVPHQILKDLQGCLESTLKRRKVDTKRLTQQALAARQAYIKRSSSRAD